MCLRCKLMGGCFVNVLSHFSLSASCRWLLGPGGDGLSWSINQSGGSVNLHQM